MISASPWDGASRAPLRVVLGALMAFDVLLAAWFVSSLRPSALSHPHAPGWLLSLGSNPPALAVIAIVGAAAAVQFARRAGQIGYALVALGAVGVLVEAQAALLEGPMRFLFFSGAALTGWVAGLGFARSQGLDARRPEQTRRAEALAEQGAVSALAACYLGAFTSKLLSTGVRWIVDGGLQATIAAQHTWGRSALLDALATATLEHGWLTNGLSGFTLAAQASAVLLPFSRRGRSLSAALLLWFHVGVWLLTPISFPQAMALLVAFGFPWPAWLAKIQSRPLAAALPALPDVAPGLPPRRAVLGAAAAMALVVGLAWLPPLRAYTQLHHRRSSAPAPPAPAPLSDRSRTLLGGLDVGDKVLEFRVTQIGESEPSLVRIALERGGQPVIAEIVPRGARPFAAPRSSALFDLFYRRPSPGQPFAPEADQLAALDALAVWLRERERLPEVRALVLP
jgi:hypothetical protein